MPTANVFAKIRHRPAKIKILRHDDRSPDPSEDLDNPRPTISILIASKLRCDPLPGKVNVRHKKTLAQVERGFIEFHNRDHVMW
jgi:hypothetical protein